MDRSLLLDLNDVIQHPGRTARIEIESANIEDPDIALVKPITGVLEAHGEGSVLRLSGEFIVGLVMDCGRCGKDIEVDLPLVLEETFPVVGSPSGLGGEGARVDDSEEPFRLFEGFNRLRVEDLLRQILILEMPMHVYCSDDCKGLCEVCGKNLNEGPCQCVKEGGHPGLQKLAQKLSETEKTG